MATTTTGARAGMVAHAAAGTGAGAQLSTRRELLILLLLCGAQFLVVLDATIVNVALPSIQHALHFTAQNLQWVASGYALTFAGVAAGLVNTMQRVGSSVGLAVLAAVATARTRELAAIATARTGPLAAPGHQVAAVVGGYDRAFLIAAALAAGASLVSLATARTRRATSPAIPSTQVPAAPAHADAA
jgi:MFS family permease